MRSLARRGGFYASARTVATGLADAFFVTLCALPATWIPGSSFVITHDSVEAMAIAYRVALMRSGRITQIVTPHELRERNSGHTDVHIQIEVPGAEKDGNSSSIHLPLI